jgi:hypothetical protein
MGWGGGQAVRYHVAEEVLATVYYDYTGIARDSSGTATGADHYSSPDNQVTAPVLIERTRVLVLPGRF